MTTTIRERVSRLAGLLAREREALAEFIAELADFDERRCWEELGYPSLFEFLVRELRLSRGNAFYRTKAVEVVTDIDPDRATLPPRPVPALALELPARPATPPLPAPVHPLNCNDSNAVDRKGQRPGAALAEASEPMTGQLSRLHLTVTRELLAKIEAAQLALSHAHPRATIADLLELGADTALAQDAKRKGLVEKPRPRRPAMLPTGSDYIPAEIRRTVWRRDNGCCQWKLASGETCGSRYRPQFDHTRPRATGGETTVANLRVLCQRHNLLAARMALGDRLVDRYQRRQPATATALRESVVTLEALPAS